MNATCGLYRMTNLFRYFQDHRNNISWRDPNASRGSPKNRAMHCHKHHSTNFFLQAKQTLIAFLQIFSFFRLQSVSIVDSFQSSPTGKPKAIRENPALFEN